jgi:hypothetical protein
MIDAAKLAAVRAEAGPCPRCGATAAKPIVWGYPSSESYHRLGDSVGWGGCVIPEVLAAYECGACGQEYGVSHFGSADDQDEDDELT